MKFLIYVWIGLFNALIIALYLLTWRNDKPSVARTTRVYNQMSMVRTCSSHWSSIVIVSRNL